MVGAARKDKRGEDVGLARMSTWSSVAFILVPFPSFLWAGVQTFAERAVPPGSH